MSDAAHVLVCIYTVVFTFVVIFIWSASISAPVLQLRLAACCYISYEVLTPETSAAAGIPPEDLLHPVVCVFVCLHCG